jgi:hypothetical protein
MNLRHSEALQQARELDKIAKADIEAKKKQEASVVLGGDMN